MPKYVRIKDGIFEIRVLEPYKGSDNKYDYFIGCKNRETDISGFYRKNEIRLSDTISELCDEYVTVDSKFEKPSICDIYELGGEKFVYWNEYSNEPLLKEVLKESDIYGAIWTDKGLIYVAKLNEKGELELL